MKQLQRIVATSCLGLVVAFGASAVSSPASYEVSIECAVKSNNDGCERAFSCPLGTTIRSARAACNLEHGPVKDEQLASVPQGYLEVVRRSDHVDEGKCWVGDARIESGRGELAGVVGLPGVGVGCQEHDKNGGDCQIRGTLYCE